jgi:hypothetical protein
MALTPEIQAFFDKLRPGLQDNASYYLWDFATTNMDGNHNAFARGGGRAHLLQDVRAYVNHQLTNFNFDINDADVIAECDAIVDVAMVEEANQEYFGSWMFGSAENGRTNAFRLVNAIADLDVSGVHAVSTAFRHVVKDTMTMRSYGIHEIVIPLAVKQFVSTWDCGSISSRSLITIQAPPLRVSSITWTSSHLHV